MCSIHKKNNTFCIKQKPVNSSLNIFCMYGSFVPTAGCVEFTLLQSMEKKQVEAC
uniref:Uncharacterized protein n=1 Tax=Anguilla anguilla TaxID=7936 RepID=A0A0E9UTX4_ANGAN